MNREERNINKHDLRWGVEWRGFLWYLDDDVFAPSFVVVASHPSSRPIEIYVIKKYEFLHNQYYVQQFFLDGKILSFPFSCCLPSLLGALFFRGLLPSHPTCALPPWNPKLGAVFSIIQIFGCVRLFSSETHEKRICSLFFGRSCFFCWCLSICHCCRLDHVLRAAPQITNSRLLLHWPRRAALLCASSTCRAECLIGWKNF